jgi:hypothetical protein
MRKYLLVLLFCGSLFAQTKGTISGYIKDPSGAFMPGVNVTLSNQQTGAKRSTISDDTGFYQILGLTSGMYSIEAELAGFKRYLNTGLTLTVDENLRSDLTLEIGQLTESVQVTANARAPRYSIFGEIGDH